MGSTQIAGYYLRIEPRQVEGLHNLVVGFYDALLVDEDLQDMLLGNASSLKRRPKSYYDLISSVFLRTKTLVNLAYLDFMIDLATRPALIVIGSQSLLGRVGSYTSRGHDAEIVERIQREWFENVDCVENIRVYERTLKAAFGDFNLQFVLGLIYNARGIFKEILPSRLVDLKERIDNALTPEAHNALDSAYYEKARGYLASVRDLWFKLDRNEYGKNFRLTLAEERQGIEDFTSRI
ncbi:hypothetical protein HYU23_01720 [Candidatus Woesearchaeota archaeon]|nr:hypothetical protein [Candidatus Woesearchaeota archaeon]